MSLLYKPDYVEALERFEAWWRREPGDRPLLTVSVSSGAVSLPVKHHATIADAWFDTSHQIDMAEALFRGSVFVAETFPVFFPNLGPDLLATLYGATLEFGPDTSWAQPVLEGVGQVVSLAPDFESRYWSAIVETTRESLERGRGKWLTAYADLHPHADLLAALRGPEQLCLDCIEVPDDVRSACEHVTPCGIEAYDRLDSMIRSTGQAMITWLHAPHQGRMYVPCCDFSALISPAMFEDLIMPSIAREVAVMDRSIYHLDGPTSLPHLDLVLSLSGVDAVQWVYGSGNGPAARWVDVYRRIQDAGKGIEVICADLEDFYSVAPQLGRTGAWYYVERAMTRSQAEDALRFLEK